MKKENFLLQDGLKLSPKRWKKIRCNVWFWIVMQLMTGACFVAIRSIFLVKMGILFPIQWTFILGILYWQLRSTPLHGFEMTVEPDFFRGEWSIVFIDGLGMLGYIFKKGINEEGKISLRVFPFFISRYTVVNRLQLMGIKCGAWARIIN